MRGCRHRSPAASGSGPAGAAAFEPLRLADEVALAIALREGLLDAIRVEAIGGLRHALPNWLDRQAGAAVANITEQVR